ALMRATGKSLEELLDDLARRGGLAGLSGTSGDMRDLEQAAAAGNARAKLALDVFINSARHYLGAYLVELGGADVMAFGGGIGENGTAVRSAICRDLAELGIVLDASANESLKGEGRINAPNSRTQIWVIPTNEELVVARLTREFLNRPTTAK